MGVNIKLLTASWGAKMRLFVGAGLSMVDLASDITMVVTYMNEVQVGNARSLLVMISTCLLSQLLVVFVQTSRGLRRVMVTEMLIVLSGIKPGVDAMRLASGAEQNEHNAFDPAVELTVTRGLRSDPGLNLTVHSRHHREQELLHRVLGWRHGSVLAAEGLAE